MKLPAISPPITEEPKDDYATKAVLINVKIEHLTDPKECLGLFQKNYMPDGGCDIRGPRGGQERLNSPSGDYTLVHTKPSNCTQLAALAFPNLTNSSEPAHGGQHQVLLRKLRLVPE